MIPRWIPRPRHLQYWWTSGRHFGRPRSLWELRLVLGMVDVNDPRLQLVQDMTQDKQGLN